MGKLDSKKDVMELRRARPLLGTLVEIVAGGLPEPWLTEAINGGFSEVARVHRLMSAHDRHSDVGRLNRLAHRTAIRVHPWTWQVLQFAQTIADKTGGIFDVSVGGQLARMGYIPRPCKVPVDSRSTWRDIELLPGHLVRFARPLSVDLGGIAKGFAVDRAIVALRAGGIRSGLVNAGGDLRAFGDVPRRIHLRNPSNPGHLIPCADITEGAIATSAGYFSERRWRGRCVTAVVDGVRRTASLSPFSASVFAPSCMLADALTKLVLVQGPRANRLVNRLGGKAFIVNAVSIHTIEVAQAA
jgi:thiamine biosynthesis lipoprotein